MAAKKLATKKFTAREMDELRESPYVLDVTQSIVRISRHSSKRCFMRACRRGKHLRR